MDLTGKILFGLQREPLAVVLQDEHGEQLKFTMEPGAAQRLAFDILSIPAIGGDYFYPEVKRRVLELMKAEGEGDQEFLRLAGIEVERG